MINVMLVGVGGFLGSISRYLVGIGVKRISGYHWFPFGTLTINILGCFLIGLLGSLIISKGIFTEQMKLFLLVGVLGGFTTFSSFVHETVSLVKDTQSIAALIYVIAHVTFCLTAAWFGHHIIR